MRNTENYVKLYTLTSGMFLQTVNKVGLFEQGVPFLNYNDEECSFYYGSGCGGYITKTRLTETEMLGWTANLMAQ